MGFNFNPFGEAVMELAFAMNGEGVGKYLIAPLQFCDSNDTELLGSLSLGTFTRSDYRKKGIFRHTALQVFAKCQQKGISLTLGMPNQNSRPGFVNSLGFTEHKLPIYVLPIRKNGFC